MLKRVDGTAPSKFTRGLRASLAVGLFSTMAGVGMAAQAEAAAPAACVAKSSWSDFPKQMGRATNACAGAKTFYFRWDRAVDGGCNTLAAGWSRTEGRAYTARFAG